ncbi:hypothetical protein [Geodermatophilus sp. URMC 64]
MSPPLALTSSGGSLAGTPARAREQAVDLALRAAAAPGPPPWLLEPRPDRLVVRTDPRRRLPADDPAGRQLVRSAGAGIFSARVALAAAGWAADVDRLPDPEDPDLLAVVRPVPGEPDAALAALAPAGARRTPPADRMPVPLLRRLTAAAAQEGALLVPVRSEHRALVTRLIEHADRLLHDGSARDEPGGGSLVLIATPTDDRRAWLRCGEAVQRTLLELAALGWAAALLTSAIEVPLTRTQLRSALTWHAHPQLLLRLGRAAAAPASPPHPRGEPDGGGAR